MINEGPNAGYDSPRKTPRGCLTPLELGKGLPGRPRQIPGLSSTLHMFAGASPCQIGRWVWGGPAISWSPVTPWPNVQSEQDAQQGTSSNEGAHLCMHLASKNCILLKRHRPEVCHKQSGSQPLTHCLQPCVHPSDYAIRIQGHQWYRTSSGPETCLSTSMAMPRVHRHRAGQMFG